jgi:hypothetical protein
MKRILVFSFGIVLPVSVALPAIAQFSPYVPPTWYDYGIIRQQTINGGDTSPQSLDEETIEPESNLDEEFNSESSEDSFTPEQSADGFSESDQEFALQAYRQAVTEEGLPADDPATAIAFFVVANYMVATGQNGDTSNSVDQAIYSQIRQALNQDTQFQMATTEEKRSMVQNLGSNGALIYLSALSAQQQGDTQTQAQLRQIAQSTLESFLNTPLNTIRLTENGIEIQ